MGFCLYDPKSTARQRVDRLLAVMVLLLGIVSIPTAGAKAATEGGPSATPLAVENIGQFAAAARFQIRQGDRTIWLTDDAIWLTASEPGVAVRFSFPGANQNVALAPFGRADARVSYLIGADPARWQQDAPVWSGVRYRELYPGVDLVLGDGATGDMPWRFETRSDAPAQAAVLRVDGANSATAEAGRLRLELDAATLDVTLPAWSVAGRGELRASVASPAGAGPEFALAADAAQQFAPTPALAPDAGDLIYSANLGGAGYDEGYGIAVDYQGNAYVTGVTSANNFPTTTGAYDSGANGNKDAFLAKYSPTGSLLYATYLGGTGNDSGNAVAVDGGLAYVTGETESKDFPGITRSNTDSDVFVAAFSLTGNSLRYTARIGGNDFDAAYGIAIQGLEAYIVGDTYSTNLAGASCSQGLNRPDMLVARLNAAGAVAYTTCVGGDGLESGAAVAVRDGVAYVTGETQSSNFPAGTLQGASDILVATVNSSGALTSSARFGGDAEDAGKGIALDGSGNIYVAGSTSSAGGFPVSPGAFGGVTDGLVVKLQPTLAPVFATYLGGTGEDVAERLTVDTVNALYVGGDTTGDFPITTGAYDTSANGELDIFVARMDLNGSAANKVAYASYLGTANEDWTGGVATDTGGYAFVTGAGNADSNFYVSDYALVAKMKVSNPPPAPSGTIATNGNDARINWGAVSAAYDYQVFRSSRPYFTPGDWSNLLPVYENGSTSFTDAGALTQADARFYLVKGVTESPRMVGGNSNRVGKFSFALSRGG